ncbi:hypothetical protein [Sulfurimonas sp. HSL-1716]|uniref:hypothetical protein n=1 Tax=Hydrocurvibacter sulfurireducens TaxID=3131937 RepID=UPI0031F8CB76
MYHVRNFVAVLVIILHVSVLTGCGYLPSSKYAREVVGDKVSTQVIISAVDPQNTVLIKDAVDSAVIKSFKTSLTDRAHSTTHLVISLQGVSYAPVQYDNNGYVIGYRTTTVLKIDMIHEGISKVYSVKGTYDFAIEPNAIISDQIRFEAIKYSATKAISSFVAKVSAQGARSKKAK